MDAYLTPEWWPQEWQDAWSQACANVDWDRGTVHPDAKDGINALLPIDPHHLAAFYETIGHEAWKAKDWKHWLNARIAQGKIKLPQAHMPYFEEPHGST